MKCVKILLEEAGAKLEDVVKITIYITDRAYREPVYQGRRKMAEGRVPGLDRAHRQGLAKPEYLMEIDIIAEIPRNLLKSEVYQTAARASGATTAELETTTSVP